MEYYKNPAASDPLLPDLRMDRAAQQSRSYEIILAWRYNSFSLYVFCQVNLASSGAILVLVTQSIEETTSSVCRRLSSENPWEYICMSNALMPPWHFWKPDPQREAEVLRSWANQLGLSPVC